MAQWVKNLTVAAWVAAKVRVRSPAWELPLPRPQPLKKKKKKEGTKKF